jgi:hypothetical protein
MLMRCPHCVDNLPREFDRGRWVHWLPASADRLHELAECAFQEASGRKGDWIQTWTGRQFFACDPRPDDFHILDIAAGLRNARYSSQSIGIETVAEHSVLMWQVACARGYTPRQRRTALMHDMSESYLVDVPRPIKRDLANYTEIEDRIMTAGAVRFDFDWPITPEVKELDNAILNDEFAQNMAPPPAPVRMLAGGPLGVRIECWPGDVAMLRFLNAAAVEGLI